MPFEAWSIETTLSLGEKKTRERSSHPGFVEPRRFQRVASGLPAFLVLWFALLVPLLIALLTLAFLALLPLLTLLVALALLIFLA